MAAVNDGQIVYIGFMDLGGELLMGRRGCVGILATLSLVACAQPEGDAQNGGDSEVLPATESAKDFDEYVVYFNALTTDQLNADVAADYGIVRSKNSVLLNIVMEHSPEFGTPNVVRGTVKASARNLTGQVRNLSVAPIEEGESIYYIAETSIVNGESLIFTIEATPEGTSTPLVVKFQKQFFVDK